MKRLLENKWRMALLISAAMLMLINIVMGNEKTTSINDSITANDMYDAQSPVNRQGKLGARIASENTTLDLEKLAHSRNGRIARDVFSTNDISPAPLIVSAVAAVPASSPVVSTTPTATPPLPFTYFGKLVDGNEITIFLVKQDQNIEVKLHDVIDNAYRVDQISDDEVTFTYMPLETKLPLNIKRQTK